MADSQQGKSGKGKVNIGKEAFGKGCYTSEVEESENEGEKGEKEGAGNDQEKKGKKGKNSNPNYTPEHHGVAIMYKKEHEGSRKWFRQISDRLMQIYFRTRGPDLVITNFYAPHTWTNRETVGEVKEKKDELP